MTDSLIIMIVSSEESFNVSVGVIRDPAVVTMLLNVDTSQQTLSS